MPGNKLEKEEIQAFADSIASWADYQTLCGRATLLSEKYMAQPIAEYLGSHYGSAAVHAEWTIGEETDKVGRPRQLDFVVKSAASAKPTMVVETKWVENFGTDQKLAVVFDLMRLHAFPWEDGERLVSNDQKLFILAGTKSAMNTALNRMVNTGKGKREAFLSSVCSSSKGHEKRVRPTDLSNGLKKMFAEFKKDYGLALPVTYRTTLRGVSELRNISVRIWEVGRV